MSVSENVNIVFRSTGIPTIKREIDNLGDAANRATRSFFLLQRAMYTLGGFGFAAVLSKQLDALTNMENRLRLTTNSMQEMESVQRDLFQVAIRARTSWEGVTEIYNRAALSAKALGIAQKDVMTFTEGVSKASVISGAGAQEARAALIQLGQAVASNRLGGDELRSVLEQLPVVADYIAKYMTSTGKYGEVNRGNIRQLGKEGKITARVIIDSFKHAQEELDGLFKDMPLTIGQSIEIARSHWMIFLDDFDDTYNISEKVANAILMIGENIGTIVKAAQVAAAAVASIFTMNVLKAGSNFFDNISKKSLRSAAALDRLNNKYVNQVEQLQFADQAQRKSNAAILAANTLEQTRAKRFLDSATARKELALQELKALEFQTMGKRAYSFEEKRFVNAEKNKKRMAELSILVSKMEAVEATQSARLAAARTAGANAAAAANASAAASANALAAAQGRAAAANAAALGWGARMQKQFPLLAGVFNMVKKAAMGMWLAIAANPYAAAAAAVIGLIALFYQFGNEIKVTEDNVVGLKDAAVAAFQLIAEKFGGFGELLMSTISPGMMLLKGVLSWFGTSFGEVMSTIGGFAYQAVNEAIGWFVFGYESIVYTWQNLGTILPDVLAIAWNSILTSVEDLVNGIIEGVQSIPEKFGQAWDWVVQKTQEMAQWLLDAFKALPGAIWNIAKDIGNKLVSGISWGLNKVIDGINSLGANIKRFGEDAQSVGSISLGLPSLPDFSGFVKNGKFTLDKFKKDVSGAAADAAKAYSESFNRNMSRDFLGEAGKAITDRARKNLEADAARKKFLTDQGGGTPPGDTPGGGGKGKGNQAKDFAALIAAMNKEAEALKLTNKERTIAEGLMKMEEQLKRSLTATERELAVATIENLENMKLQAQIYDEINGPREKAMEQMQALNALYADGRINLEQYTEKMREFKIAAEEASGTLMGGFRAAIGSAMQSTKDFGKAIGGEVVGFVNSAADAIVEFAQTGKMNLKSLFAELFANLLKLAAQRLLLSFLGGFLGFSGGGSIGPQPVMGFSAGGSITPTGPGSTDSQIVSFAKRPDERVDILTPGQQAAQQRNMNGGGNGPTVVQSPPVNVAAVLSPSDIAGAFEEAGETILVRMISRNSSKIKNALG